jgi:hypothetical protein
MPSVRANATMKRTMNDSDRRNRTEAVVLRPGVMAPPRLREPGPAVMALPVRRTRGLMELHPNASPLEWSREGVTFLRWLALVLAFVLWIVLLGHGVGQS